MIFDTLDGDFLQQPTDALVISVGEDLQLGPCARRVDEASAGALTRLVTNGQITGKLNKTSVVLAPHAMACSQLVVVGLGDSSNLRPGDALQAVATATRKVTGKPLGRLVMALDGVEHREVAEAAVTGAVIATQGQDLYRDEKKRHAPQTVSWVNWPDAALESGRIIGECVNLARHLVNLPAQDLYPESFAQAARSESERHGFDIEVWDEAKLKEEKCEALLAVARGSSRAPQLVLAHYRGAADTTEPWALVGKGVTFDSGGLSIKPSDGMKTMKCDMAGAATVLAAVTGAARLKLPVNLLGVMGLVENMVGPASYKLGDVLTARSGRTIEIHNTDAEGRLVLADALSVAVDRGASKVIDVATLTGACVVALGEDISGLMTNDQVWCDQLREAAQQCGELVWQLPMFSLFDEQIRSEIADIKNTGNNRWGGAITAAKLLEQFVGSVPWVHVDIAGPSFLDKPKPWLDAGGSGVLVRTLIQLARTAP